MSCVWLYLDGVLDFISSSSWYWVMDLGVVVVDVGDGKRGESLSSAQTTSII